MPLPMPPDEEPEPPKFFFTEKYARLGVRGNFMPLAAQPANVDLGEWLAHQGELRAVDRDPRTLNYCLLS